MTRLSDTKVIQLVEPALEKPHDGGDQPGEARYGTLVLIDEARAVEVVLTRADVLQLIPRLARADLVPRPFLISSKSGDLTDIIELTDAEIQASLTAVARFLPALRVTVGEAEQALSCVGCGCTDSRPCMVDGDYVESVPCHWVSPRLCSGCMAIAF